MFYIAKIVFLLSILGGVFSQNDLDVYEIPLGNDEMDVDIWNESSNIPRIKIDDLNEGIVEKICRNNDVILIDGSTGEKIDCRRRKFNVESLELKNIVKRDLEGSGMDPDEKTENISTVIQEEIKTTNAVMETTTVVVDEGTNATETSTVIEETDEAAKIQEEIKTTNVLTETTTALVDEGKKTTETSTSMEELLMEKAEKIGDEIRKKYAVIETTTVLIDEDKNTTETTTLIEKPINEAAKINSTENVKEPIVKKGRKIENIDELQSNGNTLTETHENIENGGVKETGPKLEKTSDDNTPKIAAASAEKDSNILLFMLGGVVAVGLTAFAYNYVKKRRNTSQASENAEENVENPKEREMKPLLNGKPAEASQATVAEENERPGPSSTSEKC